MNSYHFRERDPVTRDTYFGPPSARWRYPLTRRVMMGLLALFLLGWFLPAVSGTSNTYTISGLVYKDFPASDNALNGVRVCAFSGGSSCLANTSVTTDQNGTYKITGLKGNDTYYIGVVEDDRDKPYFYRPVIKPGNKNFTNLVSTVYVGNASRGGIDFVKQTVPPAVSGFQKPMPSYSPEKFGYVFAMYPTYYCCGGCVYHPGVDYNSDKSQQEPIYAVAEGVIVDIRPNPDSSKWGSMVIKHVYQGQVYYSQYGHIKLVSANNKNKHHIGEMIQKGTLIGYEHDIGSPGVYHLHFEIRNSTHPFPYDKDYFGGNELVSIKSKANVLNWYENPEAFIDSSVALGTNPVVVIDNTSRYFSVNNEKKFNLAGYFENYGFASGIHYTKTVNTGTSTAWGKWNFSVDRDGVYEIHAYIQRNHANSKQALYYVDGVKMDDTDDSYILPVDQSPVEDNWVKAGQHYLTKGNHFVRLDNNTGEKGKDLGFDAIKITYIGTNFCSQSITHSGRGLKAANCVPPPKQALKDPTLRRSSNHSQRMGG